MESLQFGARLRALRLARCLSLRALASAAQYSHTYLWEIETGRKPPTEEVAEWLDAALAAEGALTATITEPGDESDRLSWVVDHPRSVDTTTVDTLRVMLATFRRLEDASGACTLVIPVSRQFETIERLVAETPDRHLKSVVSLASQWAQFVGWLQAIAADGAIARARFIQALDLGAEVGDPDMVATALCMRGHQAYLAGQPREMLTLSQSALWIPAGTAVRAIATQQVARAYALLGDARAADDGLDRAEELVNAARAEDNPPWMYFQDPAFFSLQRGLAFHMLGRRDRALELISQGLRRLPPEIRVADWIAPYANLLARETSGRPTR